MTVSVLSAGTGPIYVPLCPYIRAVVIKYNVLMFEDREIRTYVRMRAQTRIVPCACAGTNRVRAQTRIVPVPAQAQATQRLILKEVAAHVFLLPK